MGIIFANKRYAYLHPEKIFDSELIFAVPEIFFVRDLIALKKLVIKHEDKEIRCTMSLGVTRLDRYTANTTAQIIKNADNAMYLAIEKGRNRTIVDDGELTVND